MKRFGLLFKKFVKGFTLVELIVIMALMVIGASIAIPNLRGTMTKAERKKYESYLLSAKANVQNYVDLLNMGEFKYPIMESDGVNHANYDISTSPILNFVMNMMNFDTSYEYYLYDAGRQEKVNGKTQTVYNYNDGKANGETLTKLALAYKETKSFKGNTDVMIVVIHRNDNKIYKLNYLFFLDRSDKKIKLSYNIAKDTIQPDYLR